MVGGGRWIRTTEGIASRFTVCPLWPLGNSPIFCCSRLHRRWSWWTDSNPRPADYKSAALPTELHQHIRERHRYRATVTLRPPAYNSKIQRVCQHPFCREKSSYEKPRRRTNLRGFRRSGDDLNPAAAALILGDDDLPVNTVFELRHMRDDAYQAVRLGEACKGVYRLP